MLITSINRVELLTLLPKAATVAEIGVDRGHFSAEILRHTQPKKLHLIDPWALDEDDQYLASYNVEREKMLGAYDRVTRKFADAVTAGGIEIHRTYSTQAAVEFPDHYFDWIYIDAMHSYESVLADLHAYEQKVKPDGFILGHDFSNTKTGRARQFGVVRAVREYVADRKFELMLMTNEAAPSFLLARSSNVTTRAALRTALLNHPSCRLIEMDEALLDWFDQVKVLRADGRKDQLLRFAFEGMATESFARSQQRSA